MVEVGETTEKAAVREGSEGTALETCESGRAVWCER